eukprot:UN02863
MYANGYPPASNDGHLSTSTNGLLSTSTNGLLSTSTNGLLSRTSTPSCHREISHDSGCTSPSVSEVMLLNHDYADPIEMRESIKQEIQKIDRQKRQNLLYEPMTTARGRGKDSSGKSNKSSKSGGGERVCKCTTQTWCLVFVLVVSSSSFGSR